MKSGSSAYRPPAMTMPVPARLEMKKKDTERTPELDAELIALADEHKWVINSVCRAACPCSVPDRNDLRQEILIRALESYPAFRHDSKFSTWFYKLAINTASVWRRKLRKLKVEFTESVPDVAEEQHVETDTDERINQLFGLVNLWEGVILAMVLEGYDNKEIGELLGIKEEAVRKRLTRLRNQIICY